MTSLQWQAFCQFRFEFKNYCESLLKFRNELIPLQKESCKNDTPPYPIEMPVVYNTALDEITQNSDIKLIVIGDNPGKSEQLFQNQKYLVGQAGKIAQGFFERNLDLQIDFRKNAIILNKTPIHSAKTKHLAKIERALQEKNSDCDFLHDIEQNFELKNLIFESQVWMAKKTAIFHKEFFAARENALSVAEDVSILEKNRARENDSKENNFIFPALWLVGYSELKKNGIFLPYKEAFFEEYRQNPAWESVFVFQHFSMNRFLIDLNLYKGKNNYSVESALLELGRIHKEEIFGEQR